MDCCEIVLSEIAQFKNGKKRVNSEGDIPVYGGNGIMGYSTEFNNQNCVIIGRVGAYCGNVYYEPKKCWVSDNAIAAVPVKNHDVTFLYYLLKSLRLNERSIGSSQPLITQKILNGIKCHVPSLTKEKVIAKILYNLDVKIKLNAQINDNLADLLQAIYQEHFGNVSSTAIQGKLSDLCSYSKDRVSVSALDTNTYFSTENMLSGKIGATQATRLPTTSQTTACHKGDTLVSNIRPYFKKIVYCEEDCGCSSDVLCFTPIRSKYSAYIFSTLYTDEFFDFMIAGSKGTKMPRGDKQQIMSYPVTLPSDDELDEFNSLAVPILAQLHSKKAENKRLSTTRDALLPKLMSGEIDVASVQL